MFDQLMTLNRDAFADAHYSVAYHLLAAALHQARTDNNTTALEQVAQVATEQSAWIDHNAPDYEHATSHATRRGMPLSIYAMLAQQASAQKNLTLPHNH